MPHELLVYGDIIQDEHRQLMKSYYGEDHEMVTPKIVNDFLKDSKNEDVVLRFNTPGGHSDAGFAIQSLVAQYEGNVDMLVDGMAASAGTMILMAHNDRGNIRRKIAKNAALMVHKNSRLIFDRLNADSAKQLGREFDSYDDRLVQSYADVTGLTKEEWLNRIKDDYYINSGEAKDLGLVDEIVGESSENIDFDPDTFDNSSAPAFLKCRMRTYEAAKIAREQENLAREVEQSRIETEIEALELTLME